MTDTDLRSPSPRLRAFVREALDRPGIANFVASAARAMPAGSAVVDAGAGDAPYAELFSHCRYVTVDWDRSVHAGAAESDVLASLDSLPFEADAFDGALCTQVLPNVAEPLVVLRELCRVLKPGGVLWLTTSFVWHVHEEPHDYYRFTPFGLRYLCAEAGLVEVEVRPLGGYFTTMAQLLRNCRALTVRQGEPSRAGLLTRVGTLWRLRPLLEWLDRYDRRRVLPLGYACTARKPH